MTDYSVCFWCLKSPPKVTRDHIIPKAMRRHQLYNNSKRGRDKTGNVVFACEPCNKERSYLQGAAVNSFRFIFQPQMNPDRLAAHKRNMTTFAEKNRDRLKKWVALERARLGWSAMMLMDWTPASHYAGLDLLGGQKRTAAEKQNVWPFVGDPTVFFPT